MKDELPAFFSSPRSPRRRQYEALRAYAMEGLSAKQAASRFDFTEKTLRNLTVRDVLHVIDLRSCDGSRSIWCPLGEGLMEAFMPLIIKFEGAVVLEFEDLQKALQSKRNLMHY